MNVVLAAHRGDHPLHASMCEEADAVGDLVPDAVLAAIATEHAAEIITIDRDFARFPSVRHHRPE